MYLHGRLSRALLHLVTDLRADLARLRFVWFELLSNDGEVRFVGGKTKHDEVSIGSAQTVLRVGVVVGLCALTPDVVHDLVFTCARNKSL